jgi:hypothetical protein
VTLGSGVIARQSYAPPRLCAPTGRASGAREGGELSPCLSRDTRKNQSGGRGCRFGLGLDGRSGAGGGWRYLRLESTNDNRIIRCPRANTIRAHTVREREREREREYLKDARTHWCAVPWRAPARPASLFPYLRSSAQGPAQKALYMRVRACKSDSSSRENPPRIGFYSLCGRFLSSLGARTFILASRARFSPPTRSPPAA